MFLANAHKEKHKRISTIFVCMMKRSRFVKWQKKLEDAYGARLRTARLLKRPDVDSMKGVWMEHIIQFGIGIDDERIKNSIEDAAVKEVVRDLKGAILNRGYYGAKDDLGEKTKEIVKEVVEGYKDEIVERAAQIVAESIKRSKKYKEVVTNLGGKE